MVVMLSLQKIGAKDHGNNCQITTGSVMRRRMEDAKTGTCESYTVSLIVLYFLFLSSAQLVSLNHALLLQEINRAKASAPP